MLLYLSLIAIILSIIIVNIIGYTYSLLREPLLDKSILISSKMLRMLHLNLRQRVSGSQ